MHLKASAAQCHLHTGFAAHRPILSARVSKGPGKRDIRCASQEDTDMEWVGQGTLEKEIWKEESRKYRREWSRMGHML